MLNLFKNNGASISSSPTYFFALMFSIVTIFSLTSCAKPDPSICMPGSVYSDGLGSQVTPANGQGIVVIGIQFKNASGADLQLVSVNPKTRLRANCDEILIKGACTPLFDKSNACKHITYRAYAVPAGTYAFGWADAGKANSSLFNTSLQLYMPMDFQSFEFGNLVTTSRVARARPETPLFTVAPGQVVYTGDLILSIDNDAMSWSLDRSDDAAAKYLEDEGVKSPITFSPWHNSSGTFGGSTDAIDVTPQ